MTDILEVVDSRGVTKFDRRSMEEMGPGGRTDVAELLSDVGTSTHVSFETADAGYRASIPIDVARDQGVIVHSDDLGPLTPDRGGPFRLLVLDGDTLCWNVKGVARLRLTVGAEPDSVPENPPH